MEGRGSGNGAGNDSKYYKQMINEKIPLFIISLHPKYQAALEYVWFGVIVMRGGRVVAGMTETIDIMRFRDCQLTFYRQYKGVSQLQT